MSEEPSYFVTKHLSRVILIFLRKSKGVHRNMGVKNYSKPVLSILSGFLRIRLKVQKVLIRHNFLHKIVKRVSKEQRKLC
jgi:hypothetical protein